MEAAHKSEKLLDRTGLNLKNMRANECQFFWIGQDETHFQSAMNNSLDATGRTSYPKALKLILSFKSHIKIFYELFPFAAANTNSIQ